MGLTCSSVPIEMGLKSVQIDIKYVYVHNIMSLYIQSSYKTVYGTEMVPPNINYCLFKEISKSNCLLSLLMY